MIKFVLLACLALAVSVSARPQQQKEPIPIIAYENTLNDDGTYSYGYEGADGTKAEQTGQQKQVGDKPDDIGTVAQGAFSYIGDDGQPYSISYVADENGFQPKGDHLPVAPPIPEDIARALAFLATDPESQKYNEP